MLQALGCYPSLSEINDIKNEVLFSQFVENGKMIDKVSMEDLIKSTMCLTNSLTQIVYVNHRPAFDFTESDVETILALTGQEATDRDIIDREVLVKTLQHYGTDTRPCMG